MMLLGELLEPLQSLQRRRRILARRQEASLFEQSDRYQATILAAGDQLLVSRNCVGFASRPAVRSTFARASQSEQRGRQDEASLCFGCCASERLDRAREVAGFERVQAESIRVRRILEIDRYDVCPGKSLLLTALLAGSRTSIANAVETIVRDAYAGDGWGAAAFDRVGARSDREHCEDDQTQPHLSRSSSHWK